MENPGKTGETDSLIAENDLIPDIDSYQFLIPQGKNRITLSYPIILLVQNYVMFLLVTVEFCQVSFQTNHSYDLFQAFDEIYLRRWFL